MERRLAALLAADVVGYSRLMGADEAGTLAALMAHGADRRALDDDRLVGFWLQADSVWAENYFCFTPRSRPS